MSYVLTSPDRIVLFGDTSGDAVVLSPTGDAASRSCSIGNTPQIGGVMAAAGHVYHHHHHHHHHHHQQQQLHPALQGMHGVSAFPSQGHSFATAPFTDSNVPNSNSLPCPYQDYQ
ncbi:hypothetical protein M9458_012795, partial [Cirrhinus mrigala]